LRKKYISLGKVSMANSLAFRGNFIISITVSLFMVVSMYFLWQAIFNGRQSLAGFTWDEMKSYLLIVFITNSLISWYSETKIAWKILDGSVAMDLLKPLDFQKARLSETLGTSILEGGVSVAMACIVMLIFAGITVPTNIVTWILFLISLFSGLLIKFSIVYIAGLFCFWTSSPNGIAWTRAAVTNLFSGALIPLAFFPDWLKTASLILPFQGIVHIPANIFLDRLQGGTLFIMVGVQLVWVIVLWYIGKLVWARAVRQVTIHGG
jgi:ABC-2 type transport system permease protein